MIDKKKCSICKVEKPLNEFYMQKGGYLEKRADCKLCSNERTKKWQSEHLSYINEYQKKYFKKNKEKIIKRSKEYYLENIVKYNKYGKEYYYNNKKKINEYSRNYYNEHNTKLNEYCKIWRENNKIKCQFYAKNRYKKNLELSTIKWMRNFLYRTEQQGYIKNKLNTISEFGYTPKQLILRIECQFKDGMSWDNRKEWHIDHKKPISAFSKETSPKIINMLSNLQPIWKFENLRKGNKY